ncbi:MAG TPA: Gfo/Idh/MocA family oxidoreductase [bacterium]|nr:Gfo/Idh/MocA family oxidoreductase [bacterium]
MTVRAAVIGCGLMGRRHAAVLRAAAGVEIVGYADPDPQALDAARRISPAPGFADHRALLAEARPDAVCVCTPDDLHREPAVDALHAGAALLVEKPLAMTPEDADAIQRAAERTGTPAMVGHLLRFDARYAAARQAVAAGGVGRVLHVRAHRSAAAADRRRRGARISALWHLAVHDVDLVRWITGCEVTAAAASGVTDLDGALVVAAAHLALEGGALATLDASWALPDAFAGRVWTGFTVTGTAGCLDVPSTHAAVAAHAAGGVTYTDPTRFFEPPGLAPQGALRDEISAFLDTVRGRTASPVPLSEGVRAVRVVAALERALASRAWVPVAA